MQTALVVSLSRPYATLYALAPTPFPPSFSTYPAPADLDTLAKGGADLPVVWPKVAAMSSFGSSGVASSAAVFTGAHLLLTMFKVLLRVCARARVCVFVCARCV